MPPSPSLSARMMKSTNSIETISVIDQKTSEITPKTSPFGRLHRAVVGGEDGLQRVERAGADVAEDDAERAEREHRHAELAAMVATGRRPIPLRRGLIGRCKGPVSGGVGVDHRAANPTVRARSRAC